MRTVNLSQDIPDNLRISAAHMCKLQVLDSENDFGIGIHNLLFQSLLPPIIPNVLGFSLCLTLHICLTCDHAPELLPNKVCFHLDGPLAETGVIQWGESRSVVVSKHDSQQDKISQESHHTLNKYKHICVVFHRGELQCMSMKPKFISCEQWLQICEGKSREKLVAI